MINGDEEYGCEDYMEDGVILRRSRSSGPYSSALESRRGRAHCKFCGCLDLTWGEVGKERWMLYDQDGSCKSGSHTMESLRHSCEDFKEKERLKRIDQTQEKIDELQIARDTQIRAIEKLKSSTYSHENWRHWSDKNCDIGKEKLARRVTNSAGKVLIKVYEAFVREGKAYVVYPEIEIPHDLIKSIDEQEENIEMPNSFRSMHKICTTEDVTIYGLRKFYDKDKK